MNRGDNGVNGDTLTDLLVSQVMELQVAYDELRSSSEKEISDLRLQVARCSPSSSKGKWS